METKQLKRLPVGIQTFSEVIDLDCLYIDKTEYIWNMIHLSKYIMSCRQILARWKHLPQTSTHRLKT